MTVTEEPLALAKNKLWPQVNYRPHRGQRAIHRSRARHRNVVAGRRAGKSQIGGHELLPEALYTYTVADEWKERGQRREFWIVGPEYSDSEKEFRVLWNDLERLEVPFDKPGSYNSPWAGQMDISLWGGAFQVHAMSAKYPGTLVGEGLSGVIMAEAAKLKQSVWHKYIRPTLADFRGWSLFTTTPEGKNWLYHLWQRGQSNDPLDHDWESWRMPSWINDAIFPLGEDDPEIIDMRRDMTEERFNQEVKALFTEFVGRVFKDWDEEIHVTETRILKDRPLRLAVDYGWTNPFVALVVQEDIWDNVFVHGEFRTRQKDIIDISKELADWRGGLAKRCVELYPDPASPGDSSILARELNLKIMGGTGGERRTRLDLIRNGLKLMPEHAEWEDKLPKLFIDRSCNGNPLGDGGLIREMDDYRYPDTKEEAQQTKNEPEEPMDKDNHGPEALGRYYVGHYGHPTENKRPIQRKARLG